MVKLLASIVEAHGGMARWKKYEKVEATIIGGGGFFRFKGLPQDDLPRRLTVWLHQARATITHFGALDQKAFFSPDRVWIEDFDKSVIAERSMPREAFSGHQMTTLWDPLHLAYFNGESFWTYFTVPFLLAAENLHVEELSDWYEAEERWKVLRVHFPPSIKTHSAVQEFYFDSDLMLRRHDYSLNISGGFGVAQMLSDYIEIDGIKIPTRRHAYPRDQSCIPVAEMLLLSIDIRDVRFV